MAMREFETPTTRPSRALILIKQILGFGLLWWILTEGASPLTALGVLGVGLAVLASLRLAPMESWRIRPWQVMRFLPYFLWQSLLGGLDVALRAMRPTVNVDPTVIVHVFKVKTESARVLFLWVVSLLPGTAGVDLHGDQAWVHVLDETLADPKKLEDLERRIASMLST